MSDLEQPAPGSDPFGPPVIPTLVGCLHCQQEYESYQIEWRIERNADGEPWGCWCCPISGCDGRGFGFDILPVDPEYQDEHGGWVHGDELDDDEFDELEEPKTEPRDGNTREDEELPW